MCLLLPGKTAKTHAVASELEKPANTSGDMGPFAGGDIR